MPKPNIILTLDTHVDTTTAAFGRAFIEALGETDPRLVPELVSETERFKDPFHIDDFLERWWAIRGEIRADGRFVDNVVWGPMWKRKRAIVSRGTVKHGRVTRMNDKLPSSLWFESRWDRTVDFNALFARWTRLARPEMAMLHLFTDPEMTWQHTGPDNLCKLGVFGGPFMPGLPNIGWAMAYGGEYAGEVDVERIRASGLAVEEVDGVTIVRVTERLSDVLDDFAHFSRRRAELKALFRPDLFWITKEPHERRDAQDGTIDTQRYCALAESHG